MGNTFTSPSRVLVYSYLVLPLLLSPMLIDPFSVAKWMGIFALGMIGITSLIFSKTLLLPDLNRQMRVVLALLVLALLSNLTVTFPAYFPYPLFDLLAFVILIAWVFQINDGVTHEIVRANYGVSLIVLVIGSLQIFGLNLFSNFYSSNFPASTFGHQNMAAEFVGASILIQIYSLTLGRSLKKWGFLVWSLTYLVSLQCRAVWVGLFVSSLFFLWVNRRSSRLGLHRGLIVLLIGSVLILLATQFTRTETLTSQKSKNIVYRLNRWLNTLAMIRENPLGVGSSTYEFSYLPYKNAIKSDTEISERLLMKSPHNGYLELTAEMGIPFALLTVLLIYLFLNDTIRTLPVLRKRERAEIKLWLTIIVFILSIAMFAFPMENAFPFLLSAIAIGILLRKLRGHSRISFHGPKKVPLVLVGVVFSYWTFGFIASETVKGSFQHSRAALTLACQVFPPTWPNCLLKAEMEAKSDFELARKTLEDMLGRQKHNHFARKTLDALVEKD